MLPGTLTETLWHKESKINFKQLFILGEWKPLDKLNKRVKAEKSNELIMSETSMGQILDDFEYNTWNIPQESLKKSCRQSTKLIIRFEKQSVKLYE